ncbi:hypothetical protein Tco_0015470 [Tanacetum coccineum]
MPQGTHESGKTRNEHLYSASASEIDEKKPKLKDLPSHLEYAYQKGDKTHPIMNSSKLTDKEKVSLLQVLEKHEGAILWKMLDIKGISPSINLPHLGWVSPIHVVPKKGVITFVLNDNNELIPSRKVTGWRVMGYIEGIVHSFEWRLEKIWGRSVKQVHKLNFKDLTPKMRQDLAVRLRMVYVRDDGKQTFVSHAWRRLFGIRGPLVRKFILEFLSTCKMSDTKMDFDVAGTLCFQLGGVRRSMSWRQFILALGLHTEQYMAQAGFGAYWFVSERFFPDKGGLRDYWIENSSDRDFLGATPLMFISETMHAEGRKSGARLSGGHFIGRLADHFGLLAKLNIYGRFRDTWTWVALGPERQPVTAANTLEAAEDAPAEDEGTQADPAPA